MNSGKDSTAAPTNGGGTDCNGWGIIENRLDYTFVQVPERCWQTHQSPTHIVGLDQQANLTPSVTNSNKLSSQKGLRGYHGAAKCAAGATRVRRGCDAGAPRVRRGVRRGCAAGAPRVRRGCAAGATRVRRGCDAGAPRVRRGCAAGCAAGAPRVRRGCAAGAPRVRRGCAAGAPRVRRGCAAGATRVRRWCAFGARWCAFWCALVRLWCATGAPLASRCRVPCKYHHGSQMHPILWHNFALREDRPSDLKPALLSKEAIRGAIPKETQTKSFLDKIANRFAANEKVQTSTILSKLVSMRYKGKENIREYIMEMSNLVTRLKALKLELSEDILVHLVLISLPTQFKEERLKQEKIESAHLASTSQGFGTNKKRKRDNKGKQTEISGTSKQKEQKKQDKEITCFFCKKVGHMKKTCTKYATWREKKGTLLNFVCSEINLAVVPTDTWWIDTGATTHISVTMQGCLRSRMPTDGERYIYVGNGNKAAVKAIGLFRLQLDSGYICGPFPTPSWNGQQYFITFIDDYLRYGYFYLIYEKSQSLDVFKNFKAKVENQLSKKIKAVRSDRGGEYYGRYDGSGEQRPGPFAKYLMECGIVPQYTMPGTPSQMV
ncbi:Retrovirus-related Pol polyprotein from transposon TNT 1-94 [Vitis vinifera]|uniref:Retrovirus-related Pol polyprotein from transposon TNT 1-94 n=1 Tax=Vitis vinifera TaxID=29760 RepID=A0A438IYS5_VITVI|nr:Retrovirus-related Pol polyprotein from transposon TNT 1-94 [Vitis vinifera]